MLCCVEGCQGWGVCESRTDKTFFLSFLIIASVNGSRSGVSFLFLLCDSCCLSLVMRGAILGVAWSRLFSQYIILIHRLRYAYVCDQDEFSLTRGPHPRSFHL